MYQLLVYYLVNQLFNFCAHTKIKDTNLPSFTPLEQASNSAGRLAGCAAMRRLLRPLHAMYQRLPAFGIWAHKQRWNARFSRQGAERPFFSLSSLFLSSM